MNFWSGEAISKAISRYNTFWLPLAAEEKESLVPPLDCALIWLCHRLNPVQYAKDCQIRFGRTIDAPLRSGVSHDLARLRTEELWKTRYKDEAYNLNLSAFEVVQQAGRTPQQPQHEVGSEPPTGYNLAAAVARQRCFAYQVSRPYMSDPRFLKSSLMRYKAFLHLARLQYSGKVENVFLVPTYDIDLFWHAHQLSPVAYQADTTDLIGKTFGHDDSVVDRTKGQRGYLSGSTTTTCT